MAAGALDHAASDGQARRQVVVVAQERLVLEQVVSTLVDRLAVSGLETAASRTAPHGSGNETGATVKNAQQALVHPLLGLTTCLVVEGQGRLPKVLQHVDHIHHDGQLDTMLRRQLPQDVELMQVAVPRGDPPLLPLWVPAQSFLERLANDRAGLLLQAGPDPLVLWSRAWWGQD